MTYRKLFSKAIKLINQGEITLGEYEEMIKPLDREVEQESVIDKVYAEIEELQQAMLYASKVEFNDIYKILDKYKAEKEST